MEDYRIIQGVLKHHPDVLSNRTKLKGIMSDFFPNDKLTVNMFLMAYDEGFIGKIENVSSIDEFLFQNFVHLLTSNYGVTEETAKNVVHLLANVFNISAKEPANTVTTESNSSNRRKSPTVKKPSVAPSPSAAQDFRYASNGTEVQINKYLGKGGTVVIPDFIDGLPVTRIAECAFEGKNCDKIKEISLPKQLEYIGSGAFQNLDNLTGILILPTTLKMVDCHAFQSTGLKGLIVQSSCTLDLNSFANIDSLEFIYVAKGCAPVIDTSVFSYAEALTDIILPKEVNDIAKGTFKGCNESVLYTPKDSYAAKYGQKNFMCVNTDQYEQMTDYYRQTYNTN